VFRGSTWLTASSVQAKRFSQCEADGEIFSVHYNGLKHYAAYQLGEDGEPLPIIKNILQRVCCDNQWAIAAWFYFPNSWISRTVLACRARSTARDLFLQ
jgi:hypothetical protein